MNFNEWFGDTLKSKGFLSPVVYPGDLKMVWDSALEEAAKVCESKLPYQEEYDFQRAAGNTVRACAATIRNLK